MVFTASSCRRSVKNQIVSLCTTFMGLTMVCGTIRHDGLWKIMYKFWSPDRFIILVRQFHECMLVTVQDVLTRIPFDLWCQAGFCLGPTLFSMMFSASLIDTYHDGDIGFSLRYCFDGKLFKLWRLPAKTSAE